MAQLEKFSRKDFPLKEGPIPDFYELIRIDQALIHKVSKPNHKKRISDKKPFFIIKIETNYGKYGFINQKIIPKRGDVITFLVTDSCYSTGKDLEIIGSISEQDKADWDIELKQKKKELFQKRVKLAKKIIIGKPYYSPMWGSIKVYVPRSKAITKIFVEEYDGFYYGLPHARVISRKRVYAEDLSLDEKGTYQREEEKSQKKQRAIEKEAIEKYGTADPKLIMGMMKNV